MKIAIITPSRGRPKELYRFFESVNSTVSGQNRIYFLFGIDEDDPSRYDYYSMLQQMLLRAKDNVKVVMVEEEKRSIGIIWNELARMKAWKDSPDVFIMGNDDLMYDTPDWDIILEEKLLSEDHPFYMHWFDDGLNGERHCAFPIVTKHWIAATGSFAPECFLFFYHDTWVYDIAKKAGVARYIPEVKISHLHFSNGSSPNDRTYAQWRNNPTHNLDTDIFRQLEDNRKVIAATIQDRIDSFLKSRNNGSNS